MFETVDGRLMLTYRDGSTDNGRNVLARYNHDAAGTWTYLGQFSASTGNYTSPFGTSSSRYAYLHGFGANPRDRRHRDLVVVARADVGVVQRERPWQPRPRLRAKPRRRPDLAQQRGPADRGDRRQRPDLDR